MASVPLKQCRICGDSALGFNFNVLSCESCKAFFRRHALKDTFLVCKNNLNCTIDRTNRAFCKRCRLDKCFSIGMKKNIIFSRLDSRNCADQSDFQEPEFIYDFIRIFKNSTELKSVECCHLIEVKNAASSFRDENTFPVHGEARNLAQICNLSAYNVKQVVQFCKGFRAYINFDIMNQLNLLKNFYPEKTTVRIAFMYDAEKDGFVGVEDETKEVGLFIRIDNFRQWKLCPDFYSILRRFVRSLCQKMQNDTTIRDLILSQLLFKPRPNLTNLEFVRYQHFLYRYLLRRYLEHKHGDVKLARRKYCSIICVLKKLDQLTEMVKSLFTELHKSNQLTKILAEIYE